MFLYYFGLIDNLFLIVFNLDYFYMSLCYKEVFVYFIFGLWESGGFVMFIGEVGMGKIMVLRKLL